MSIEEIRELKHAQPFRPFELITTAGRKVRVRLPYHIALAPNGQSVTGFGQDGSFLLMLSEIKELRAKAQRRTKTA